MGGQAEGGEVEGGGGERRGRQGQHALLAEGRGSALLGEGDLADVVLDAEDAVAHDVDDPVGAGRRGPAVDAVLVVDGDGDALRDVVAGDLDLPVHVEGGVGEGPDDEDEEVGEGAGGVVAGEVAEEQPLLGGGRAGEAHLAEVRAAAADDVVAGLLLEHGVVAAGAALGDHADQDGAGVEGRGGGGGGGGGGAELVARLGGVCGEAVEAAHLEADGAGELAAVEGEGDGEGAVGGHAVVDIGLGVEPRLEVLLLPRGELGLVGEDGARVDLQDQELAAAGGAARLAALVAGPAQVVDQALDAQRVAAAGEPPRDLRGDPVEADRALEARLWGQHGGEQGIHPDKLIRN